MKVKLSILILVIFSMIISACGILPNGEEVNGMAEWILPTEHEDPSSEWVYEARAYDNDTNSYAYTSVEANQTSGWLVLKSVSVKCTKIRFAIRTSYYMNYVDITVELYFDGAWHSLYSGNVQTESYQEKSIGSTEEVSAMRIRFSARNFTEGPPDASMPGIREAHFYGDLIEKPTVNTITPPSAKDHESATLGGNVVDDGGKDITERGFEYKEGAEGEVSSVSEEDDDFGTGAFSLEITGLEPNTEYYFRAYAVNPLGTSYGDWKTFTTDSTTPIVTYDSVSNQTATGFTLNGTITEDGGITCSVRGFDVGLTKDVYTSYTDSGSYEEGSFSKTITGLVSNTTYWVRAKVTNANGSYNSAWTAITTAAAGTVPTNKRLNIVTDYGGYGYNMNHATTDDGETYTAYFEFTTDLLQDQLGIMLFKRLLEVWLFINSQSSGSITLYVKEDTKSSWQTAGTYSMIDSNQVITRVHLPVDYRAIIYQFKLESSSYFEFLGLVGGYRKDGFR